jgi:hypothetical protein
VLVSRVSLSFEVMPDFRYSCGQSNRKKPEYKENGDDQRQGLGFHNSVPTLELAGSEFMFL